MWRTDWCVDFALTFWFPAPRNDSIISPLTFVSPFAMRPPTSAATIGWFVWIFCELPWEQSTIRFARWPFFASWVTEAVTCASE